MPQQTTVEAPHELTVLIAQTDEQIAEAKERRRALEATRKEIDATIDKLERARAVLMQDSRRARRVATQERRQATRRERTSLQRAGSGNVEKVLGLLREGPLTTAAITTKLAINNGTVTYALRHLVHEGLVTTTGKKVRGSHEFKIANASARSRVSRPGDR